MSSLFKRKAVGSDHVNNDDGSLDWLLVFKLVIPLAGHVLKIKDLKALRSTCKGIKQLIDPHFKKLEIDIDEIPRPDYLTLAAMATSPLLEHVRELSIYEDVYSRSEDRAPFWGRCGYSLSSTVHRCAPRLTNLGFYVQERENFVISRNLFNEIYDFSSLKRLAMGRIRRDALLHMQKALFSMTFLEKLEFYSLKIQGIKEGLHVADLRVLAAAPFVPNLIQLEIPFDNDYVRDPNPENDFPFTYLLQRATKLRRLILESPPSLQCFNGAPLENLEYLEITRSRFTSGEFSLPRSLVHLNLTLCRFTSASVFTMGMLPRLEILEMDNVGIYDNGSVIWLPRLNLPSIESISINDCSLYSNHVYQIAEVAWNIPNLKEYKVECCPNRTTNDVVEHDLVERFCDSSVAAKLENLELRYDDLTDEGFQALVENAEKMQSLEKLGICISDTKEHRIEMLKDAGQNGGWPMLQKLTIFLNLYEYRDQYSLIEKLEALRQSWIEIFDPVWPGLQVTLRWLQHNRKCVSDGTTDDEEDEDE